VDYLRFGWNLLKGRLTGRKVPLQLNIHLTDVCNLRCTYCYVDFDNALADLPTTAILKILKEARECGTERVSFEGGEPLARKDIGEIVQGAKDLGLEVNVNTNAYFIPRHIDSLSAVDVFSISIDGPEDVHDALRGNGSFAKAVEGARVAREAGHKIHFLSVMTARNRDRVDEMLDLAEEHGATWVPNSLFFMAGHKLTKDQVADYIIEDDDYRELIQELLDKKAAGRPIAWSNRTLRYVKDWPTTYFQSNMFRLEQDYKDKGFVPVPCQASRFFVVMQTNGDLYSCDPLLGYAKPANAVELGFKEALEKTSTHGCIACNSIVCSEYHHLFTMNVPVILNLFTHYARRRSR